MRIIKESTLKKYFQQSKYKQSEDSIKAWVFEVRHANWDSAKDIKAKYGNASIINSKRVVFNIKGNNYRLVADVEYKLKVVFVVWFGTHTEYDKIDVKTINYDN